MSYRPLSYPSKPIEVLQVRAPRASYWRAVVLAGFDGLRFTREPQSVADARHQRRSAGRGCARRADACGPRCGSRR